MVNVERVEQLVAAMLNGVDTVPDYSGADLTSAGFTLAARLIGVSLQLDPTCHKFLQNACEQLLMRCADPTRVN
jgi:hypothetical protein